MNFNEFGLDARLTRAIEDLGFSTPTPIQAEAIPSGRDGRDVIAAAMTGSGKTIAFLLPVLHRMLASPKVGTRTLILTPTRELAAQILEAAQDLTKHTNLRAAAIFGGVGMGPQEAAFRNGVSILIATPGRLLDHLSRPYANLNGIEYLVLDEADRMLDMGFLPDVRRVLSRLPTARQTLFFSATMPPEVRKLSQELLKSPVAINVERKAAPAKGITQALFPVSGGAKSALLLELLKRDLLGSVIVFSRTKHRTNRLSEYLEKHGVQNARIHGNRSQGQRTAALADFKAGKIRVLCATDIVARGIDVEALEFVVNFDVPHIPADYIHRVGRTARADAIGEAFTFVSPEEEDDVRAIERAIGAKIERRTLPDFDYAQKPKEALEIPLGQRIAEIRARKADERAAHQAKQANRGSAPGRPAAGGRPGGRGSSGGASQATGRDGRRQSEPRRDERSRDERFGSRPVASSGPSDKPAANPVPSWRRPAASAEQRPERIGPRDPDATEVMPGIWRRGR